MSPGRTPSTIPSDQKCNPCLRNVLLPMSPGRTNKILVGARGFEPPTPCAQGRCATRLRYAPTLLLSILNHSQPQAPFAYPLAADASCDFSRQSAKGSRDLHLSGLAEELCSRDSRQTILFPEKVSQKQERRRESWQSQIYENQKTARNPAIKPDLGHESPTWLLKARVNRAMFLIAQPPNCNVYRRAVAFGRKWLKIQAATVNLWHFSHFGKILFRIRKFL
jgi:hypothetical protein